ncbi:BnaA09g03670D [Brassica napus]|uniref:BnaA09g03670D protein n=1 Tax=Brassica napus TaxID=3708 RepID=A0A078G2R5_BRANA|nr:BnaA09g03670D [Brassica napus]
MECNKEEASRAKALAENMMLRGDFPKAQKLVVKAQRLFSGLDSLPQMLAVCDVHCSADQKINGLENWYGILQVQHFSDDAAIKKQYRKLALLLHPDKNQFAGAEAAFKLVGEANRLLADKEKRSQYDIKRRINSQVASRQWNANSGAANSTVKKETFWTCCEHCGYKYNYLGQYVNSKMYCSRCQRSFMAYDVGFNGVPPKPSTSQKEVQHQGPCGTPVSRNVESTCVQPGSVAAEVDKKESAKEKFNEKNGGGEKNAEVRKPKIEDGSMKNDKPKEGEEKVDNVADLPKADGLKPQPEVTEPEKVASRSVPDKSVSRTSQAASVNKGKRKRREIGEETTEVRTDSKDNSRRTSPRKRQQVSSGEKGRSDGALSPHTNRSSSKVGLKSERTTKKQKLGVGSSKRLASGGSSAPSCVVNGKANKRVDSGYQESLSTEDNNHKPVTHDSPDPDFHNFELATSSFAVNQVWSLYDPTDGMPRSYARITKVSEAEFKVCITWLDPLEDNNDNSVPIACGIFQDRESQEVDDRLIFSCQMLHVPGDNNTVIYPRAGEVWAVFRGWDSSWNGSSGIHKGIYEYDFVEVLCDFNDVDGVEVAYLGKVEGFVSLFRRNVKYGFLQLQIPPNETLRFSHKVPSFKLTGRERESVPPGCFELDTAALPKDMFEVVKPKVEVHAKKHQKLNGNHSSSSKASEGICLNHEMNSVKKSKKSVKAVDGLKLRQSPRSLSQSRGNGLLNGTEKASVSETRGPSSCTTRLANAYNFENQRSENKFQIGQIWAIYSNDDKGMMPRKYAQVKRIDTSPEFKLHVAPLELCRPPNLMTHPLCCGSFRLKTGTADVLVPSSFSHQIKAVKKGINRYEVYPGKGEIWALYKNWNTTDCAETEEEELEIVEVVETNEQSVRVVLLAAKVCNKLLYGRCLESVAGFVDIPKTEVKRFSHQVPAFRRERSGDYEWWELDSKALIGL